MQTVHFRFYGPVCSGPGPLAATPRLEHQPGAAGSPKTGNWSFTMPMAASCHSAVARALEGLLPALRCTKHRRILPEQAASTVGLLSATQLTRLLRFRRCRCRRLRCFGGRTASFSSAVLAVAAVVSFIVSPPFSPLPFLQPPSSSLLQLLPPSLPISPPSILPPPPPFLSLPPPISPPPLSPPPLLSPPRHQRSWSGLVRRRWTPGLRSDKVSRT